MHSFPLTRTVLNLCLVVVMAFQPVAFATAQGTCRNTRPNSAALKCSNCQCCDVSGEHELCGCCGGSDGEACCGDSGPRAKAHADEPLVDPTFGEISPVVPVASDECPPPTAMTDQGQFTGCLCGLRSEPAVPSPVRIPAEELRETLLIAFLSDRDLAGHVFVESPRSYFGFGTGSLAPHFSQRNLCVWRL